MKTFQSINESMFANSIVNSKDMAVILGGNCTDKTGAGTEQLSDSFCCSWASDSFTYDDSGKLLSHYYLNVRCVVSF